MYGAGFLIFIIIRIILAARAGESEPTAGTRTVFFALLRGLIGVSIATMAVEQLSLGLAAGALAVLAPGVPVALVSALGVPVLPFWLTRSLRPWSAAKDNRAAAVFWELRARARFGLLLAPPRVQKLADSIFLMSDPPAARSYSVAALAMIDALCGNVERARTLFNLAMEFRHNNSAVRRFCHAWLMADAVQRGSWTELLRLTERGPSSLRRALFRACAEQLTFTRSHSRLRLRVLWLLAPGRRRTLALLRASLRATRVELTPLGHDRHAAFDGAARLAAAPPGTVTRSEVEAVAARWQQLLDRGTLREHLLARMTEQGAGFDVERALASLEEQVVAILTGALADVLPDRSVPHPDRPLLLLAAEDRLQDEQLSELEALSAGLEVGDAPFNADLEALVRRWAEIRWTAQRYLDSFPQSHALFYDNFGTGLLNHGAWLHNQAAAYPLACDVFRWLSRLPPAEHEDLKLLRANEKLSYGAAKLQ